MSFIFTCILVGLIGTGIDYLFFPVKKVNWIKLTFDILWNVVFLNSFTLFVFEYIMNRPGKVVEVFTLDPFFSKKILKYILIALFIELILCAFKALFTYGPIKIKETFDFSNWKKNVFYGIFSILIVLMSLLTMANKFLLQIFARWISVEVSWFNVVAPSGSGADPALYWPIYNTYLLLFILIVLIVLRLTWSSWSIKINNKEILNSKIYKAIIVSFCFLTIGIATVVTSTENKIPGLIKAFVVNSNFLQDNYVSPDKVKMEYPKKKRNIVHIYLESMESSYMDKKSGGNMDKNLMPAFKQLSREPGAVHFSNNEKEFGGPYQTPGTLWSMAGIVNMTAGLPLQISPGKDYGGNGYFLPGATTLGDILHKQGYNQVQMEAARANFAGETAYWLTHGYNTVYDYNYAREHHKIPKNYYKNWGMTDKTLYKLSKQKMNSLAAQNKPFNMTIENADTHYPNGYVDPGRKLPYKQPYANAIFTSQKDVVKLVKWIQSQPYGKNTTIVLTGDHLSMDQDFFNYYHFTPKFHRTAFNLILNGDFTNSNIKTKNRQYAPFDYFPTIVESLGIRIPGHRLGLGTDLTSNKKTLLERFGVKKVYDELSKRSPFYQDDLMSPKHHKNRVMEPQDEYVKKHYGNLPNY